MALYHYGRHSFSDYSEQPDFAHLPGGLWLSDGSWLNLIIDSIQRRKKGWHYRHLKFVTSFAVQPSVNEKILVIKDEQGMHDFVSSYGESINRELSAEFRMQSQWFR